jgi:hypothetical protein
MLCDYIQTSDKKQIMQFLETVPEGCVMEVTVHSVSKQDLKHKTPRAYIYIDDVLVYDLDFVNRTYLNLKQNTEFYMTPMEAFALNLYLCSGIFETIPPHWWAYAERNIARHNDPLKYLREAKETKQKIVVTLDD